MSRDASLDLDAILNRLRAEAHVKAWSIYAAESRRMSLGVKDRQAGNAHAPLSFSESCGARYLFVWDDGRVSRGSLERRQIESDPEQALSQAAAGAYEDPDAAQVLGPAAMPEVELYEPRAAAVADGRDPLLADRLDRIRDWVNASEVRTWSGSFAAGVADSRLVTSAGLDVADRGSSIGWHVTVNGEVGDGFAGRGPETEQDFVGRLDRLARTAERLRETAEPPPGGVHPVILHPRVVESYVLKTLLFSLQGSTVDHGEGHFRLEQFGSTRPVIREDLNLYIDPLVPLKRGSYRYTTQGLPAARCDFIERGRLLRPMLDLKYARRLGLPPTPLTSASDVLHFGGPAPLPLGEAIAAAAGGALVLSVLGVHTQDNASGDFSLSAPQALRLSAEGYAGRLRTTLSGNLFELLQGDALQMVRFEGEHTPGLLLPCRLDSR